MIDSVFRTGRNYYPQVILEECRFVIEKKMPEYIIGDIESSYGNSAREDSDKILIKKILMKKIRYRMSQMIYSYILWTKVIIFNGIHVVLTKYIIHINIIKKK